MAPQSRPPENVLRLVVFVTRITRPVPRSSVWPCAPRVAAAPLLRTRYDAIANVPKTTEGTLGGARKALLSRCFGPFSGLFRGCRRPGHRSIFKPEWVPSGRQDSVPHPPGVLGSPGKLNPPGA